MTETSWHLINELLPLLDKMKTEPNFHTNNERGTKPNPAHLDPLNFNALVLEQEIEDIISIHLRKIPGAQTLQDLLNAGYPANQPPPLIQAWEKTGSIFLEDIHGLIRGETRYTRERKDRLHERADTMHLNLYQITQALTVLGYEPKYDTIKKWAKRGHLTHNGEGYSLGDALERFTKTECDTPNNNFALL